MYNIDIKRDHSNFNYLYVSRIKKYTIGNCDNSSSCYVFTVYRDDYAKIWKTGGKRMIKKIRVMMLVCMGIMIAGLAVNIVNAEDRITEAEKIDYLKSIGTTEEAIAIYNQAQIDELYYTLQGKDVKFSGIETTIVEIENKNSDQMERNNISTSKLQLSIGTYDMERDGKVIGIDVTLGYKWLESPLMHFTDAFTFTWNDALFYDDGFYAMSNYTLAGGQMITIEQISRPATGQAGGLGWYLNTAVPHGAISNNYGGAQILLRPRTYYTSATKLAAKMYFTYAHQLVGAGITIGPDGPGVTITGGKYDQQTFSYTYH